MKKICLLGVSLETSNMGVSALSSGLITAFSGTEEKTAITLLDFGKQPWIFKIQEKNGNSVNCLNIRFSYKVFLPNNIVFLIFLALLQRCVPGKAMKQAIVNSNKYLKEIMSMDYYGAISAGDSFASIYGLPHFFYVTLPMLLIIFSGKNLVLLPQTYGPFKAGFYSIIATFIFKRAAVIMSRDYKAKALLEKLLPKKYQDKLRFCCDVAFLLKPHAPQKNETLTRFFNTARPKIGFNISGLLWIGGYTGKNMFGLLSDYKATVEKIVAWALQDTDADVLLVPHVFGDERVAESDVLACGSFYTKHLEGYSKSDIDRITVVDREFDHAEIKSIIGQCDFFIGSRMHACIAAISQSVPAISLAYSDKFIGVMEMLEIPELVVDLRKIEGDGIMKNIAENYRAGAATKIKLQEKNKQFKKTIVAEIWKTVMTR
jgi:colanic acid/amylovoran biosynthesis protein